MSHPDLPVPSRAACTGDTTGNAFVEVYELPWRPHQREDFNSDPPLQL